MKHLYTLLLCALFVSACGSSVQSAKDEESELIDSVVEAPVVSLVAPEAQNVEEPTPVIDSVALKTAVAEAVAKKESVFLDVLKEYVSKSTLNVRKKPKAPERQCFEPIYEDGFSELDDWEYCEYPFPLYGRVKSVSSNDFSGDVYLSFNARGDLTAESIPAGDSTDPTAALYKYNANKVLVGVYLCLYRPGIEPHPVEAPSMVKKFDSQGRVIKTEYYTGGVCWNSKCSTIKTKYRANGRVVEDVEFDAYDEKVLKTITKYNSKGCVIEKTTYNPANSLDSKSTWKYDKKGRVIECATYNNADSLVSKKVWKYDKMGRVIEAPLYDDNATRCTYKYDKMGNKVEIAKYDADSLVSKKLFCYCSNGILAHTERYDGKDSLECVTLYSYDKRGNMIEKRKYNNAGELQREYSLKYDRMGNVIEARLLTSEYGANYETTYNYKITYYK